MTDSTRKLMKKADELLHGYQDIPSSQIKILLDRVRDKNIKIVFVNGINSQLIAKRTDS